jgi:alanyl-tRNA synthetase
MPRDPSVLFTTAGMQQFKNYFLGEKSPDGDKVTSCQKCFRTSDIDEVGDSRHLTFFEMLGNFSFGAYFKEEAIELAKEFIDSIKIKIDYVTVFAGDKNVPKDEEAIRVWEKLGFSEKKGNLELAGREDNFWGPTGEEGPCGPTTEIYAAGIEIWNLVFNEYYQDKQKKLTPLKQKGVDTGMGLERLAMVSQGKENVFETDLLAPLVTFIEDKLSKTRPDWSKRIVADHARSITFLIADGVLPSKKEQGYVLRRLIGRAIAHLVEFQYFDEPGKAQEYHSSDALSIVIEQVILQYGKYEQYKYLLAKRKEILMVVKEESDRFLAIKDKSDKLLEELCKKAWLDKSHTVSGQDIFDAVSTHGIPLEWIKDYAKIREDVKFDFKGFEEAFKKHQEISRAGAEKKFVGGLADHSEKTVKYHTAAHLMLAALRQVLGPEVSQKGSNITAERLRFDFNYPQKMTESQIKEVEGLVNQKIKENIPVVCREMPLAEAKKEKATGVFEEKYGEQVKVYVIGEFSKEICGGPHVKNTGDLGQFQIAKEESSGAGIRRIRAILN